MYSAFFVLPVLFHLPYLAPVCCISVINYVKPGTTAICVGGCFGSEEEYRGNSRLHRSFALHRPQVTTAVRGCGAPFAEWCCSPIPCCKTASLETTATHTHCFRAIEEAPVSTVNPSHPAKAQPPTSQIPLGTWLNPELMTCSTAGKRSLF